MPGSPGTSVVSLSAIARLCAIVAFPATTLASQAAPTVAPASNDARKASVVSQLTAGATIRVATSDRLVFEGRYARLDSESLVLYTAAGRDALRISLAQIDTLWTRARNPGKWISIGALIGGVLGGGGVAILCTGIAQDAAERRGCGSTVAGAAVGGALLGGVIGAIRPPGWHQRWPQ
jgi:hypothetical protein